MQLQALPFGILYFDFVTIVDWETRSFSLYVL